MDYASRHVMWCTSALLHVQCWTNNQVLTCDVSMISLIASVVLDKQLQPELSNMQCFIMHALEGAVNATAADSGKTCWSSLLNVQQYCQPLTSADL